MGGHGCLSQAAFAIVEHQAKGSPVRAPSQLPAGQQLPDAGRAPDTKSAHCRGVTKYLASRRWSRLAMSAMSVSMAWGWGGGKVARDWKWATDA